MHRKRYLLTLIFTSTILLMSGGVASAQMNTMAARKKACSDSAIISGLWKGVNMALGIKTKCPATNADGASTNANQSNTATATPPKTNNIRGTYVALGDSVAAGLGLQGAAPRADPACGTSTAAYPFIIARNNNIRVTNLACSGATAGDLFTEQHLSGTSRDIEPQLDQAFASGTPALLTITAGANDMRWQDFVRKCYIATCGTSFDQATTNLLRDTVSIKLTWALRQIDARSGNNPPTVILTGYYHPLGHACNLNGNTITSAEASWINKQLDNLNETIRASSAQYSFAKFAPVSFAGHELCTADPWVQDITATAPLHPTAAGQRAIANAVSQQL